MYLKNGATNKRLCLGFITVKSNYLTVDQNARGSYFFAFNSLSIMIRSKLTIIPTKVMINAKQVSMIINVSYIVMSITSVFHISNWIDIYVNEVYVLSILRPHTLLETEVVIFLDLFAVKKDWWHNNINWRDNDGSDRYWFRNNK